jgi:NAD(P)-dependent dehydrogenase (short-subunit alcohol dehydrogenase family)
MKIRFSTADLELFAAASHDRNPLHLSAAYARKTPFGQPLVYGALGALACWSRITKPAGFQVAALRIEFSHPIFPEIEYQILADEKTARIMDGSTQLLKCQVEFCPGEAAPLCLSSQQWYPGATPQLLEDSVLVPGFSKNGEYQVDPASTIALLGTLRIGQPILPVIAILWSSYVTGMELPGERALFFKLSLDFVESAPVEGALQWQAKLISRNPLNQICSEVQIFFGGRAVASGHIETFLRPKPVMMSMDFPPSQDFAGTAALVIGASRGLGASISRALVLQGTTVLANFQHSRPEAEQLAQTLEKASGRIILHQGDAADLDWVQSLQTNYRSIDFLILNACPVALRVRVEPATVGRINEYLAKAFATVLTPLAVFAGSVKTWTVLISSIYAETVPKEFPQYVAAKAAVEGLFRATAKQQNKSGYLIVRPPKLLTDMTNTPYGADGAMVSGDMAARIIDHLRKPVEKPGSVELLTV